MNVTDSSIALIIRCHSNHFAFLFWKKNQNKDFAIVYAEEDYSIQTDILFNSDYKFQFIEITYIKLS
jgi:hypothetical protein